MRRQIHCTLCNVLHVTARSKLHPPLRAKQLDEAIKSPNTIVTQPKSFRRKPQLKRSLFLSRSSSTTQSASSNPTEEPEKRRNNPKRKKAFPTSHFC